MRSSIIEADLDGLAVGVEIELEVDLPQHVRRIGLDREAEDTWGRLRADRVLTCMLCPHQEHA
ncbi:MAG: hypothetical protein ACLPXZ_21490 [Mycobacterium sp.]